VSIKVEFGLTSYRQCVVAHLPLYHTPHPKSYLYHTYYDKLSTPTLQRAANMDGLLNTHTTRTKLHVMDEMLNQKRVITEATAKT
jgi:hypothetical protein